MTILSMFMFNFIERNRTSQKQENRDELITPTPLIIQEGGGGTIGLTLFIDDAFVVKVARYWHRYFKGAFCLWLATYSGKKYRPIS